MRLLYELFSIPLILFGFPIADAEQIVPISAQVMGLKAIYDSTGGEHWEWVRPGRRWNFSDEDPCLPTVWQGLTCVEDDANLIGGTQSVQSIVLRDRNMTGAIQDNAFINLTKLVLLDLSSNNLTGSIPNSIGDLSLLQILDLSLNSLSGELPTGIELLTKLKSLDISDNLLSGCLPQTADFVNITYLDTSGNLFTSCTSNSSNKGLTFIVVLIVLVFLMLVFILYECSKGKKKSHNLWARIFGITSLSVDTESQKDQNNHNPMHNTSL